MTNIVTLASRRAAPKLSHASTPATAPTTKATSTADLVQLHAQACNSLHSALRFLTHPEIEADSAAFAQALRRAMRATSALKQACAVTGSAA